MVNHGRYAARTHGFVLYGTTANEAFHNQIKNAFVNRSGFTREFARAAADLFLLRQLVRAKLARRTSTTTTHRRPQDYLASVVRHMTRGSFKIRPRLCLYEQLSKR